MSDFEYVSMSLDWRLEELNYDETFWNEMENWMKSMKESYPEYEKENLFTLRYVSRDKKYFTEFEEKLSFFTETIPYIRNENNPFDEAYFGDLEQLMVKALLQKYKTLYPDMDYEEIYDTYVKKVNESEVLTPGERRNRYIWNLIQVEEELSDTFVMEAEYTMPIAIAGCVMLVLEMAGVMIIRGD